MRKLFASVLMIFVLISNTTAGSTLTLDEALMATMEQNLNVKQAAYSTAVAENTSSLANAGLLPRLDLSSGSTLISGTTQTAAGAVDYESSTVSASLNASYTLFNGLQGVSSYKLLNKQTDAAELQERLITENTLLTTAGLFVNVLLSQDQLMIMKEQLEISRQRLDQGIQKRDMGITSSLAALSAQVDFDADSVAVVEAEFAYHEAMQNLNLQIGWELGREYQPQNINMNFGSYVEDHLIQAAMDHNVVYLLSLNSKDQTDLILKGTMGSILPKVSVSGSYGAQQSANDFDLGFDNPDLTTTAGINLSWNLFDGRKKKSIESGRIMQKSSELARMESERQLKRDVESALNSYKKSLQVLEMKKHSLSAAELNFRQTSEYYRLGHASSTEFRTAQVNLSMTKRSEAQARYTAYLAEMNIWQLTGKLIERTIRF